MATETEISYTDHTKSPWRGCQRVSEECRNCYVEGFQRKFHDKLTDRRLVASFEQDVRRWNKKPWVCDNCGHCSDTEDAPAALLRCPKCGRCDFHRARVFGSLYDWLDDQVPIEWLANGLRVMHECPNLIFLLSTKRPENWRKRCELAWRTINVEAFDKLDDWLGGDPPANIWLGVTYGMNNPKRMEDFLRIPAKVRWLSVEPILERIYFDQVGTVEKFNALTGKQGWLSIRPKIDWVVVGGESGPGRREAKGGTVEAIRNVVEQCKAASVPVWVKQDCHARPGQQGRIPDELWRIKQLPAI